MGHVVESILHENKASDGGPRDTAQIQYLAFKVINGIGQKVRIFFYVFFSFSLYISSDTPFLQGVS